MNRTLRLAALLLVALLAFALQAEAACKVKADDASSSSVGKDADNKIQDAPIKRVTNKISFDVVRSDDDDARRKRATNKIAFDVPTNASAASEDYSDEDDY